MATRSDGQSVWPRQGWPDQDDHGCTASDSWTYGYDDLGRLTSAANGNDASLTETYAYADNGNLTARTRMGAYSYPAPTAIRPHAVTTAGTKAMSYDANGNMISDGTRTLSEEP